jgi:APA family basic amino acid/polyamine antiporter
MQQNKQGELVRTLGLFSVFILTVSSVIGSGVYKKVAPMSTELGSPGLVLLCWVAAGLITVCGALSNAEVASLLAGSGGEYGYFRKIYNRFFAFLFGWSSFTAIRSASAASIAYVFAQSSNLLYELPRLPESWERISLLGIFTPFDNFGVKAVAIILILVLSYVNYKGLKLGEGVSKGVLYVVVASIFLIIILGLTIGGGSFSNLTSTATDYVSHSWTSSDLWKGIFAALLAAFWAYEGWSPIGFLGGEIKNPNRNLPLALVSGVLFVMLVYVAINFTYLFVMPIDQIIAVTQTTNSIAAVVVVQQFLGAGGAIFMAVLILFTTFGCTNTTLLSPPRLYYTMAKEGMFFKKAATIHPKYNTPSTAIWYQAIWASVLVLSGSFDQLTDMLIFASFIFYGATTLGVFILRYRMPDTPRPYKAWGYPVVPALFIIFCVFLIVFTLKEHPREALIGLTLMLSGIPFYLFWRQKA